MAGFGETNNSNKRKTSHSYQKYDDNQILNKAINYHYGGNIFQARKLYKFLIDKGSENSTLFGNYGLILINFGKLKDAEFFIRKAINLNPNDSKAHYYLGNILKDLGKLQESELSYRKAIKIKPDHAEAYLNLGNILRDLDKLKEAKLCTEKVMSLRSWSISGSYNFNYYI